MKNVLFALSLFTFALSAQAANLKKCKIYKDGERVKEVSTFEIENFETEEPAAIGIDASLFEFTKFAKSVKMDFSNECDNMYTFRFSKAAIEKALSGEYKKLIGKAEASNANMDMDAEGNPPTVKGIISCDVVL